jgi:hypothetical protein
MGACMAHLATFAEGKRMREREWGGKKEHASVLTREQGQIEIRDFM